MLSTPTQNHRILATIASLRLRIANYAAMPSDDEAQRYVERCRRELVCLAQQVEAEALAQAIAEMEAA